jgi:AcrR family transcriptional regulator
LRRDDLRRFGQFSVCDKLQAMTKAEQTTSERILNASLMLFNEHGYQNVPALKIAQHLGISHGNLAYHFKTKSDIVMTVFPLLEQAVRTARTPGGRLLPGDAALHQIEFARTLWRYRFFFNALTQLLSRDERLRARFMLLQETVVQTMQDLFDEAITQGDMKPVELPTTTRILSRCCWMTWLSWLRFEQIDNPTPTEARNEAVYNGCMLSFGIVQAYFSKQFSAAVLNELRRAVGDAAKQSKPTPKKRRHEH